MEEIKTDLLVIGGGAAGLTAALEAKNLGLDVTLIAKSKVGRSGNTIVAGTGMAVLMEGPESEDTGDIYKEDTLASGKQINDPGMVKCFLNGSPGIAHKLTGYGVVLRKMGDRLMKKQAPGHSTARSLTTDFSKLPYLTRGLSLTLPLLKSAQKCGIKIIDFAPVIKLLLADGTVAGALAIDKKREKVLIFRTPTVILAAGGGGRVYSRSNNTRDITGDSYTLAFDAGATLRDMEFVQFYPTMMFSPVKVTISSPLFGEGAYLRNGLGERFMEKYHPAGDMATRDIMTRAMFNEVIEGRGDKGNIYMDCRDLPKSVLTGKFPELLRLLSKANLDPSEDLLPISPATHFFMGGVAVNSDGESSIPGLLACGEAVGGLHGANRLGGNALSEAFVFGMIAGSRAAKRTRAKNIPGTDIGDIEPYRSGDVKLSELKQALRETTWKHLSIIRNRQFTEQAQEEIDRIEASLGNAEIRSVYDLVDFYEIKSMITTTRLIACGGIARKESRGAHFRSDFPKTDDDGFKGSFYFKKDHGKLTVEYHPLKSG
jgi:succinate dehydrogenase/fumarate reductase flavoprotein subunit